MKALITGAGGLVGSAACRKLLNEDWIVVGIENNQRKYFFGEEGSTVGTLQNLIDEHTATFGNYEIDIRNYGAVENVIRATKPDLIIHTAAQPSHDWAAREPHVDFGVNAVGTLNLLQAAREHCVDTPFCHVSTSKVYGDNPNRLPLEPYYNEESAYKYKRYVLPYNHRFNRGIDTSMSIDKCLHSLFGASKAAGDLLVQEYGRYFDMPTLSLRPGCVTGSGHASVELHGFLSYLMKCAITGREYTIYGYDGLQVRCNIHADDLVDCFLAYTKAPIPGFVANIGGGLQSSCSMLEAIDLCEEISDKKMNIKYDERARIGDHKWWISDNREFSEQWDWEPKWTIHGILEDIWCGLQKAT